MLLWCMQLENTNPAIKSCQVIFSCYPSWQYFLSLNRIAANNDCILKPKITNRQYVWWRINLIFFCVCAMCFVNNDLWYKVKISLRVFFTSQRKGGYMLVFFHKYLMNLQHLCSIKLQVFLVAPSGFTYCCLQRGNLIFGKGQLISVWIFGVFKSPKKPTKLLTDFWLASCEIWYHSEPLEFPYFPTQFLGTFSCHFLQQTSSNKISA